MSAGPGSLRAGVVAGMEARQSYHRWVLLVALSGLFATTFPVTVLTLAIPTIADDFGVDQTDLAWVLTLPILCSALTLPALGKLGDLWGHRRVFLAGFVLAMVTTALTATATGPLQLIGWRTLSQTLGGATMPSSLALINAEHHQDARARAMGWWSMVAAGAPVVGLTVGAPAIDSLGWQTLFLLQAGLMIVPVAASWLVLREVPRREARFDVLGAVTLALGMCPLLLAVDQAPEWGVTSWLVLGCGATAVVGLALFAYVERRVEAPLLPAAMLRSRDAVVSVVGSFLTSASYMGGFFLASLLMVEQFDYTLTAAVPILSVRPVLFAVSSPVGGWLTSRVGNRATSVAGCVALAGGLAAQAAGAHAASLAMVVGVGFLLQGIGYGLLRPAISTALANAVDQRDLGIAGASERLGGQLGVAFGITVLATVYGGDVDRFAPAFAVGAGFGFLGLLVTLAFGRPSGRAAAGPAPELASRPSWSRLTRWSSAPTSLTSGRRTGG